MILKTCNRIVAARLKCDQMYSLLKTFQKFSTDVTTLSSPKNSELTCDLLVVGGGAGGCSIAARFARQMKNKKIIIVEPNEQHYYQPMFTLIGGGIKTLEESVRPMENVLPSTAVWVTDRVKQFDPDNDSVITWSDVTIIYQYMVISCGIELNYENITGLPEALASEDSGVCSIYSPNFAEKTFKTLQNTRVGNAIFTFPNSQVKCAGAPLKICYLAEHFTRLNHRRDGIKFLFKTSMPVIFAAKYYAGALLDLCKERDINVSLRSELIAIKPEKREATFRNLDKTFELDTMSYSMLHVTPPMNTPPELRNTVSLVDKTGYLNVDKCTLQHVVYKNIFGIGDCTNLPTSKTAAAVSAQGKIVHSNLTRVMNRQPLNKIYNGYTSCPLITSYGKCILAEFDYERNPIETFPIDQRKERVLPYYLKKSVLPQIYWWCMRGFWNGPELCRKICHFGFAGS